VTSSSALKEVLGPIRLEPVSDRNEDFYSIMETGTNLEIASGTSCPRNDGEKDFPQNDGGGVDSRFRGNDKTFKPYYVAHTKIQTLALLDERHQGSNWLHWRREEDSNP
ncbi:MAG: hypothetical protein KKH11_01945, partial [Candidatus Omnitrophica bacterium]|nr:hypothetical protein [Candidatus Omnitrophota bacterium]